MLELMSITILYLSLSEGHVSHNQNTVSEGHVLSVIIKLQMKL